MIIVNDGSIDNTWNVIRKFIKLNPTKHIIGINYTKNEGKGFAVRLGMSHTSGSTILMLDADGATKISEYSRLQSLLANEVTDSLDLGIVIGSRNHLVKAVVSKVYIKALFVLACLA